jgi:predicted MFS family arabinose efflux permease
MFLVCGTATSAWAPMVPYAKSRLGLDEAALGLVLLCLGGGSILTMPIAGVAIHRWSTRPVLVLSTTGACAVLPLLAGAGSPGTLAAALLALGAALGAMDVAMNAEAIGVQRAMNRPVMSAFHALFSVGGLLGAAAVGLLLRAGATLTLSAAAIAAALVAVALPGVRHFGAHRVEAPSTTFTIVPRPAVLLLGALCFISFLAEGVVLDWSAVFLREFRGVHVESAGVGYAVFSVAMAAGRFTGDAIVHRLGAGPVLRAGAALAALGFVLAAGLPFTAASLAGFAAIGFGAANIVPILFSASGHVPGVPAGIALATVTTIAYAGLLAGPALVGFVAAATSLPTALLAIGALLGIVWGLGGRALR